MVKVLSCLVIDHDLRFVLLAALICLAGCMIAIRLFSRVRRSEGGRRYAWLFLASFLAGATIWTTHFTAMMGFDPGVPHGYEPQSTFLSLLIGVAATFGGFFITALGRETYLAEAGGAILGLGVGAMHYSGVKAYQLQGSIAWDDNLFGALAMNRAVRPVTRFCRYGSVAALILAICGTHFTAMGAMVVVPDAGAFRPEMLIPQSILAFGVVSIMVLVLATGAAIHFIDVQTQNEAVDRYRHLALHDPLTSLPNRAYLNSKLESLTDDRAVDAARTAFFAFDLDRFKLVNDVHGHAAGDVLLRELAARIQRMMKPGEFLARVGGDEFVAVKSGIYTKAEASQFADAIVAAVCEPFPYDEHLLSIGASIGISIFPIDGQKPEELLTKADLAMYRAKSIDGPSVCFYDKSMDEGQRSRRALAVSLRQAVAKGELELYYQPQNDAATRQLVGFEALLRWNHPERGMVSPGEFIPIAEESGLICEIGEWVLREACREASTWAQPYRIAVNVAPLQLAQTNLPTIVHEALLNSGLGASRLELEITETGIIEDQTRALHVIRQLKSLGVRIAMDDYGTGYSSLATLKNFPFDKIKIDRSFVDGVNTDRQAAAIVRATIILGSSLDIPVLAEGVESEEHLAFLNAEGCHEVQGFYFGRPLAKKALDVMLAENAPKAEQLVIDLPEAIIPAKPLRQKVA
jgi:diguanylate cyclase